MPSDSTSEIAVEKHRVPGVFNKPAIHLLIVISVVFLIYSNTFNAPFLFDDNPNIVNNPAIKDLDYFSDPLRMELIDKSTGINKHLFKSRYIGYLTFALNYRLHGLDVTGYHLVNIIIHALNSILLYFLMTLTFRTPFFSVTGRHLSSPGGSRSLLALFAALLFAVHPIQTQAVTYIVQRFASLATLFYLLSLVMYITWKVGTGQRAKLRSSSALYYGVSLLSAVLAMKTKEISITLPVVLAMYELFFFNGKVVKRLLYLTPFFLSISVIPLALAGTGGSIDALSGMTEEAVNLSGGRASIPMGDYLFTQFRVIVTYIRLLFLPVGQNLDYDYPVYSTFFDPAVLSSFMLLLLVFGLGVYLYHISRNHETRDRDWLRMISFGIFWFFVTLSVESSVIPIIDVIFEHRVYLPSAGFFLAVIAAIGAGSSRLGSAAAGTNKAPLYVMLILVPVLSGVTYVRNAVWEDSFTLWESTAEGSPNKARPHHNLGLDYAKRGRTDEAIKEFTLALRLKPDFVEAHYDLGVAYASQGRIDEAIKEYQEAVRLYPNFAQAHNNLGLSYLDQGRTDDAIREFQTLLMISPGHPMARKFLDFLLKRQSSPTFQEKN